MSRPPAYVFVVRHGNRLDAADKQWHLTSPTPYDPPLTYGGWLQCKALGARVASILRDKEAEDEALYTAAQSSPDSEKGQRRKRKRYKVILHSSPFLRCIQTSIAISAGIASTTTTPASGARLASQSESARVDQVSSSIDPASTRTRPTITIDVPPTSLSETTDHVEKTILRLDPFLGEWASPDYFDHITPPPKSSLMLMTAKAELLRKENYISYPQYSARNNAPTSPSQLWNSPTQTRNSGLDNLPNIGDALPGGILDSATEHKGGHRGSLSEPAISPGYIAPIPSYAVSTSEPIPVGYVAHARDACVDIDYQWDSTRDPMAWGEGGVLPEEWANMHQRFRKGLKRLVDWYSTTEHPGQMVTKMPTAYSSVKLNGYEQCSVVEDDFEIENVVILVSHGAGCNALVGGVTNQPVLADVPMASLSIAKRRTGFDSPQRVVDDRAIASLDDALSRNKLTVPELYELPIFASTDHLSGGSGTVSRSPSVNAGHRGRDSRTFSSALRDINFGFHYGQPRDHRSNSLNASLGSIRRASAGLNSGVRSPALVSNGAIKGGITVGSGMTSFGTAPRTNSFGMWTPKQEAQDPVDEPDLPMTLDFSCEKEPTNRSPPAETIAEVPEQDSDHKSVLSPSAQSEEHDSFDTSAIPSTPSGSGMWGIPRPPDDAERMRDFSSQKRRWTVTEREPMGHRS